MILTFREKGIFFGFISKKMVFRVNLLSRSFGNLFIN